MGRYIETGSNHGKADHILRKYDGVELSVKPKGFATIPKRMALIVVVNNGPFEAAAYAYDKGEFEEFTRADEKRPRRYILIEKEDAERDAG